MLKGLMLKRSSDNTIGDGLFEAKADLRMQVDVVNSPGWPRDMADGGGRWLACPPTPVSAALSLASLSAQLLVVDQSRNIVTDGGGVPGACGTVLVPHISVHDGTSQSRNQDGRKLVDDPVVAASGSKDSMPMDWPWLSVDGENDDIELLPDVAVNVSTSIVVVRFWNKTSLNPFPSCLDES
ncbi:hypothetical protein H310_04907 [Aphanomyces invadans]|uniref:Uncharacterized protein n=1 Tax=Aphanomyces invadans TaxID=157072 RepID=A0A024UB96_9STRA|nr:hypothetical protein H310_04907 [Aphanomyces invadans]ETW03445.1 hypothetical protein H310_04907 [Aphanomyces invadans]|eukprot:XP_008867674.1 hypothetical protein H310_04907 [Aphanomyces invadans]